MGASIVAGSGLVFIGGATDEILRAFHETTGELLWVTKLPVGGYTPPPLT